MLLHASRGKLRSGLVYLAAWPLGNQRLMSGLRLQSPHYLMVCCLLRLGRCPTPLQTADQCRLMSTFLQTVVCTPVDKAADTFVFQCLKVYAHDLMTDLQQAGTYELVDTYSAPWKQTFQTFNAKFSLNLPPLTDTSPSGIIAMHGLFKHA